MRTEGTSMRNPLRRLLTWGGLVALALYACGAIVLYRQQRELLFPGRHTAVAAAAPTVDGMESFRVRTSFTTIRTFARRFWMPSCLVLDPFDNQQVVGKFAGPILLMHGRHDGLIPPWQAEALAASARRGELHLYECGHDCWFAAHRSLLADMQHFLLANAVLPPVRTPPSPDATQQMAN
jgi:pimeloyl-ACP methyl ester carboxylesterase